MRPPSVSRRGGAIPARASAVRATEALGIGIGERGRAPGRFYTYGGDPRKNGTGAPVTTPKPS